VAGLYVHFPFCRSKCHYCDFYSIDPPADLAPLLAALDQEAFRYQGHFTPFETLYFGGGTPSLLEPAQLQALFGALEDHFAFTPEVEVTLEVNPDDITLEKLHSYRELGCKEGRQPLPGPNRISVGVQSLDDGELRFLGRRHTALQGVYVLDSIRRSGFQNLAVDLIYGLPGQSLANWRSTLERVLHFNPEHLSCYQLTLSPGTVLGKMLAKGLIIPLSDEEEREFFLFTSEFLESHGYTHYEISNFARGLEFTSLHNLAYWRHEPYLGLGPSAHSFRGGRRWWNVSSVKEYASRLSNGALPVASEEVLSPEQLILEEIMLGLRTRWGVSLATLQRANRSAQSFAAILSQLEVSGLATVTGERLRLTRTGLAVADSIPRLFL
jgi:putative oxygen-independent coproporphyrinogen III oxidase